MLGTFEVRPTTPVPQPSSAAPVPQPTTTAVSSTAPVQAPPVQAPPEPHDFDLSEDDSEPGITAYKRYL